jgi:lipoate-protein ligase A
MDLEILPYDLEDDLPDAVAADGRPHVRVYRVDRPLVVLGRGSQPDVELHLDRCLADGVLLTRRRGGGCSVVIDPGNVIVAMALPAPGLGDNKRWFHRITGWMIETLAEVGVAGVSTDGISDLVLGDRKISGSCIWRTRDRLLYSATLLVDPDLDLVERYLAHPPREPEYRRGRPHRDFMGRLGGLDTTPPGEILAGRLDTQLWRRCDREFPPTVGGEP